MKHPSCVDCRYWQPSQSERSKGQCRRRAPVLAEPPSPYEKNPMRIWPSTRDNDWCGDYAMRPGDPE